MSSYNYKQVSQQLEKHLNFNRSEKLALRCGFEMVIDKNAYNGRYFIQDGKKWIHNIDALKRQLNTSIDSELEEMGYDVEAYYSCYKCIKRRTWTVFSELLGHFS